MSARYSLETDGLIYLPAAETDREGNPVEKQPIWLCSPLSLVSLAVDEEDQWGKLIQLVDPNGQQVSWVMPSKLLGKKDELWQALLAKGVNLASSSTARNLLHDYLSRQQPAKRARVVSRLGWYLDGGIVAFVRPDMVLGNSSETGIIYQNGPV